MGEQPESCGGMKIEVYTSGNTRLDTIDLPVRPCAGDLIRIEDMNGNLVTYTVATIVFDVQNKVCAHLRAVVC